MTETNRTAALPESASPTTELVEDPHGYEENEAYARRLALGLRSVHYDDDLAHPDTAPCPAWCDHAGEPGSHIVSAFRTTEARHESESVATVASCYRGQRRMGGATAATLVTRLVKDTTRATLVKVDLDSVEPSTGGWAQTPKLSLSLDDAQELVTVLQHLIAQADAAEVLANEEAAGREHDAYVLGLQRGAEGVSIRPTP